MIVRTLLTCKTDLPDDAIETEDGMDFVFWGGRNVVEAITDLLRGLGWTPEDPIDLQERGWDMDATSGDASVSLRVQVVPELVIVIFTDEAPKYTWYFKRKPPGPGFTGLLTGFDKALKADSRFSDLLWFTDQGYRRDEPGAPEPVEAGT
jgi:hypothetical protein